MGTKSSPVDSIKSGLFPPTVISNNAPRKSLPVSSPTILIPLSLPSPHQVTSTPPASENYTDNNRAMVSTKTFLLPFVAIMALANAWQVLVTLVGGRQYTLSGSDDRTCDGLPVTNVAVAYFDFTASTGATTVELYTGAGCSGNRKTGSAGHTDSNPDLVYQSYKVY